MAVSGALSLATGKTSGQQKPALKIANLEYLKKIISAEQCELNCTRLYRNERLVAAATATLESLFSNDLRVSTACVIRHTFRHFVIRKHPHRPMHMSTYTHDCSIANCIKPINDTYARTFTAHRKGWQNIAKFRYFFAPFCWLVVLIYHPTICGE